MKRKAPAFAKSKVMKIEKAPKITTGFLWTGKTSCNVKENGSIKVNMEEVSEVKGEEVVDGDGWDDIPKEKIIPKPPITCTKGDHIFYQANTREAKCRTCPVGYILGFGMTVMDGHIYKGDELVI